MTHTAASAEGVSKQFGATLALHRVDFAVAFEVSLDGYSRSAIHADFSSFFPERADSYFDDLHHRDGSREVAAGRAGTTVQRQA